MFFCEPCRDKNEWPASIMKSTGTCEMCGEHAICHDIPSSALPRPIQSEPLRIWIDTETGTWGSLPRLRVVDLADKALHDAETDTNSLVAFLDAASDSEIAEFGKNYGNPVQMGG
jgi:hypothetical protein